jgi:uncharacterized surface protein with fasciclin (FAS1) repeats
MKLTTLRRGGAAAAVLALSISLAACGSDEDSNGTAGETTSQSPAESPAGMSSEEETTDAGAQTFGDACGEVPTDGAGSFNGMVNDPVATAASANPLLQTLVAAVGSVDGLADTLNSQEALTVFAPYEGAFAEIPQSTLKGLLAEAQKKADKSMLYSILAHHVLPANEDPDAVVGDQDTLAGDSLTIAGDAESGMTVSDGTVTANVLCGNIPTANATVYVIDKVLTGVK